MGACQRLSVITATIAVLAGCQKQSTAPSPERPARATGDQEAVATDSSAPEKADIRELKLRDWEPRSMLTTRNTAVERAAFSVIDVHNHLDPTMWDPNAPAPDPAALIAEMDRANVRTVINLDGGSGEHLEKQLERYDRAYPGRFLSYALLNFDDIDAENWSETATARLRKDFEAGAKGLKIHKFLGLKHRYRNGELVKIDDPKLDPLWALCAQYRRPVVIHTADPAAFFTPLDRNSERWHELNEHPEWLFVGKEFPSREELLDARNRVIARHPKTTFIGAHFGNNPEDLATVGKWLDAYPNLYVDIDARISELGRQPYSARRFFVKYQDRIMFGTDTLPKAEVYQLYFRFLETDDEYWDTAASHHRQGFWMIYGIYLPKPVLEKVYNANAARIVVAPVKNVDRR